MKLYFNLLRIIKVFFSLFYGFQIEGKENLPKEDGFILCANHISMRDPFIIGIATERYIRFIAKKELFENSFLNWLLTKIGTFPVNRQGSDLKALRTSINILRNKENLGIFPEGTRIKNVDRSNMKEGIGLIASRAKVNIVPITLDTRYKLFKKIHVIIHPPIEVEEIMAQSENAVHEITERVYHAIYEE